MLLRQTDPLSGLRLRPGGGDLQREPGGAGHGAADRHDLQDGPGRGDRGALPGAAGIVPLLLHRQLDGQVSPGRHREIEMSAGGSCFVRKSLVACSVSSIPLASHTKRLMWIGVGVGVGVDFSKTESESLKFGRLRSTARDASKFCRGDSEGRRYFLCSPSLK